MSTTTLITKASTTLTAIQKPSKSVAMTNWQAADIAAINALIIDDRNTTLHLYQSLALNGLLVVPNRGVLKVLGGDVIGVDANGWPVLVSAQSIAVGNAWTL